MEVRPGYKQTEVGPLPEDWEVAALGGLVRITSGTSPSLFRFSGSGIPYFKVEQLSNAEKYLDAINTPYLFESGDTVSGQSVIFAKRGAAIALNKVRILKGASFMDTNLMALTPRDGLECEYLYYALGHIGLWRFADTTSVPQINNKHVKPLPFPLPSPAEQRAIAEALSDVDALLSGLDRLIAKKRDLKQAAMQKILTGKTRLPGFNGEWEEKRLGDVIQIKKGQLITRNTLMPGDIPVVAGGKQPAYFHAFANRFGRTITISASGASAGYVALYNEPIYASDCSTISEAESYCIDFVFYQLLLRQETIYKSQTGGAQPHVHAKDLNPIPFTLPSIPEQTAIAEVLTEMDSELAALEARRDKTGDLKQAMMQELLTGRTRLI
jgi:type I restriction enzyme, S subunit